MNIYLVTRKAVADFDETFGVVVIAATETQARVYASTEHGDEGPGTWIDPERSLCQLVGTANTPDPGVLLRDFHAG